MSGSGGGWRRTWLRPGHSRWVDHVEIGEDGLTADASAVRGGGQGGDVGLDEKRFDATKIDVALRWTVGAGCGVELLGGAKGRAWRLLGGERGGAIPGGGERFVRVCAGADAQADPHRVNALGVTEKAQSLGSCRCGWSRSHPAVCGWGSRVRAKDRSA